ncbi:MAG TPA: DUF5680 domain-containing protein [archaeon]|nr:DUF5680 domain-containing protein [archaeon]
MKLNEFITKAKIATYASGGKEKVLGGGIKELKYKHSGFEYRDRYCGFNPFSGQEIVWKNGKIVWSMIYYGKIISSVVPAKTIYKFLREALRHVNKDMPFRGSENFSNGKFNMLMNLAATLVGFLV